MKKNQKGTRLISTKTFIKNHLLLSKKVDISENITVKSVKKIVEAETQDIQCHAGKIIKSITESKLKICNPSDKNKASTLIRQYLNNTNLTKEEYTQLMEEVLNQLSMII